MLGVSRVSKALKTGCMPIFYAVQFLTSWMPSVAGVYLIDPFCNLQGINRIILSALLLCPFWLSIQVMFEFLYSYSETSMR